MRFFALTLGILLLVKLAVAGDLDEAYERLKVAQSKNDAASVKKLAAEVHTIAARILAAPVAPGDSESDEWTDRMANARSADLFSEYALYATAVQSEPPTLVDLVSTLESQNPKSKYLDAAYGPYLIALSRSGSAAKVPSVAEKALANFPENEDLLLVTLDTAMRGKQSDRALTYANRLIAVMTKHRVPTGTATADWERKKARALAQGYWSAGVIYGEKGQYVAADKNLRSALPLIGSDEAMLGPALFHLGMANYQIGKMTMSKARVVEGARFSERCAAINSQYTDQARHNALVMKSEGERMR
jgi:tetratricopeptide (TPR) repeat protein